jgi:hypothetical protein
MRLDTDDICTRRLTPGRSLKVRDAAGCTIQCCAGMVWITQEGDARDIYLSAGECFTFDRSGIALISPEEGMKDEWMADTGITVISLPARLVLGQMRDS